MGILDISGTKQYKIRQNIYIFFFTIVEKVGSPTILVPKKKIPRENRSFVITNMIIDPKDKIWVF